MTQEYDPRKKNMAIDRKIYIKEVDIAVTRDGIQKHYYMEKVEDKNEAINNEENKVENSLKDEEKECCFGADTKV